MAGIDAVIKQWVKQAERSGEVRSNKYTGKKFDFDDGFMETPQKLRMTYKILKNANYLPPEVEMLKKLAELREQQEIETDPERAAEIKREIVELQGKVTIALEKLPRSRT